MHNATDPARQEPNPRSRTSVSPGVDHDATANQPLPIETAGEFFPGGITLELIVDPNTGQLLLLFTDEQIPIVGKRIDYNGRAYVPLNLDIRILRAVRFPHEASDYVSTRELFTAIQQAFMEPGFLGEVALLATHFVFSCWFPDCVPAAPCLLITGPSPEAELLFHLLGCLVRRPLHLVDFNRNSLSSLMKIQPTLLIGQEHLSASKLRLMFASNNANSYVSLGGGLVSFYSAKAIYRGMQFKEDSLGDPLLRINLTPLRGKLPILDSEAQEKIARKFQAQLLNYRTRNIERVRQSAFDFPWLTSGMRILARVLGACIVDAPELQAGLAPFFQRQQQGMREQAWLDKRCVAIETGLAYCHSEQNEQRIYVGKFADDVNTVFKGRGHVESLEPEEMGKILRSLGFSPERDRKGYAICLTDKVRRHMHRLAFQFEVAALLGGKPRCPHCHEILKGNVTRGSPTTEKGESPNP